MADLVDAMIDYWKDLVPLKSTDGGRGAILFRCIHALMSLQVQNLIRRSLDHLYVALNVYKVCIEHGTLHNTLFGKWFTCFWTMRFMRSLPLC